MLRTDVIVLGAGMVGVSAALHLQQRGRSVVLVDRRGPGEETSYGNAGLIQREGVVPYPFPRDIALLARYAFNQLPESNLHWSALPRIAPWLLRYWRASTPAEVAKTARGARPLVERCIIEHEALMAPAGLLGLVRRTGYMRVYRSASALEDALDKQRVDREVYGVNFEPLDAAKVAALEPHLKDTIAGGILMPDPVSVSDPGALVNGYATLFEQRGGRFEQADARSLEAGRDGWIIGTPRGPIAAAAVVLALGPWSDDVFRPLGYRFPLGIKRGYHQHFKALGNATLNRPVLDAEFGYLLAPMTRGIRLTTGAEFALRDAPPTPVQLARVTPLARDIFPLGEKAEPAPWLGRRPCLPDMLPIIGPAPSHRGLWFNFGHHHLGFTLGPVAGRLLAEMMTGEKPFTDPSPYRAERF
ncbi:MAG: FAD-binding oxidoreductase [Hyphomonadaceae bacterium]|nr:FAD-binding oxidoreductase [Hyphomonadaceae bacterium]